MRLTSFALGTLCLWTGIYAAMHFNPPAYADPGGVNACWLALAWLVVAGLALMTAPFWRLNK